MIFLYHDILFLGMEGFGCWLGCCWFVGIDCSEIVWGWWTGGPVVCRPAAVVYWLVFQLPLLNEEKKGSPPRTGKCLLRGSPNAFAHRILSFFVLTVFRRFFLCHGV